MLFKEGRYCLAAIAHETGSSDVAFAHILTTLSGSNENVLSANLTQRIAAFPPTYAHRFATTVLLGLCCSISF